MFDVELVREILKNIIWSVDQILLRSKEIESYEQFLRDDTGLEKLDSICMQLINIGESLKQIDKLTEDILLIKYSEIDWKNAKGMRDIITHHYFDIDAEVVFVVIREKLPLMKDAITKIINDLT
jgi:uncharacterized protein with HEPN domain